MQADVISILMEKMDTLNLDLFSCLLPVLVGLLDSKIERYLLFLVVEDKSFKFKSFKTQNLDIQDLGS